MKSVIPLTMKLVSADVGHSHLCIAGFDPLRILVEIDFASCTMNNLEFMFHTIICT